MNILDVVIILLFITAILRGIDRGLVRQFFATLGLVAGLFLGSFIQGWLVQYADNAVQKASLILGILIGCVVSLAMVGEYVGGIVKGKIDQVHLYRINKADRIAGAGVGGLTLLFIVWLGAALLINAPLTSIQQQIKGSFIISTLNKTLPPAPTLVASIGNVIDPNGFPDVFTGLEPKIDTNTPLPSIGELDNAVQASRVSVVKVEGEACGGVSDGSGFIADTGLVVTNAHVIAGVDTPFVIDAEGRHKASVLWFDKDLDLAIVRANGLAGEPLPIDSTTAPVGTPAAVLGYPGGGDFTAEPATILESFNAEGRDIYGQGESIRQIYSVRANVQPGNSGGPMVDAEGEVVGVVFAESTEYDQVGYALTMEAVLAALNQAKDQNTVVDTGYCTH
ncbi:MAG TPA: MarP family serine protease [Candidatus Saccharimonadales bacterium]|nr:MarP family serine protease [Candidatus Saccharimonadales bacterium]